MELCITQLKMMICDPKELKMMHHSLDNSLRNVVGFRLNNTIEELLYGESRDSPKGLIDVGRKVLKTQFNQS
jgi:hypothetical protein